MKPSLRVRLRSPYCHSIRSQVGMPLFDQETPRSIAMLLNNPILACSSQSLLASEQLEDMTHTYTGRLQLYSTCIVVRHAHYIHYTNQVFACAVTLTRGRLQIFCCCGGSKQRQARDARSRAIKRGDARQVDAAQVLVAKGEVGDLHRRAQTTQQGAIRGEDV